jgi:predicted nucleotide-binding protein (sugar kinase/HSP70/actin superfamily)
MIRVGIPRALLYYQYLPMWKTFFEELGAEVIVSPTTTQSILAAGSSRVVADTCLPAKVFMGHVLSLTDKCDFIFIPAIRSLKSKSYNCSKFLGLPDMTRAVIPESHPILEIDIDINKGKRQLYQSVYKLGRRFTWNPFKVKRAAVAAWQAHLSYRELMSRQGLTPPQAIDNISGTSATKLNVPPEPQSTTQATIGLIGHAYLLYDEHINYQIVHRLQQSGNIVLTPEMLGRQELEAAVARTVGTAYWTYEEDVVGAGSHYLQNGVDGVIGIMAFGCGPDSLMMDMIHRQANRLKTTPFMCLTLEEHTSEAGVITRLEAFLDMIYRRKRKQEKVCV